MPAAIRVGDRTRRDFSRARTRAAVKRLWGPVEMLARLRIADDLDDAAIRGAIEMNVLGVPAVVVNDDSIERLLSEKRS
jgi:hypothetical protein